MTRTILGNVYLDFESLFENTSYNKSFPSFPPCNLTSLDEDGFYHLELALAGYSKDDIEVSVKHDKELSKRYSGAKILEIKGDKPELEKKVYTHKGIATRKFNIELMIDINDEIEKCKFENGILLIKLKRVVPEEYKPKSIKID